MRVQPMMFVAMVASSANAQSPIAGFWNVISKECLPGPGCAVLSPIPWSTELAIDVQRDRVIVTGSRRSGNPWALPPADTLRIDGDLVRWLPGRRGIARSWSRPDNGTHDSYEVRSSGSRLLWPGETWTVSSDGRLMVHEFKWKQRGDTVHRVTWTYRRTAG